MNEKLNVFYEDIKVGELERGEELTLSFQYSDQWLSFTNRFQLSLAMPFQKESFGNKITLSFFENLLPEGEVRKTIANNHKIESPYEFLREFGRDCAGAILLTDKNVSPNLNRTGAEVELQLEKIYKAIKDKQSVAEVISEENPGYLSIAGAQDKFPANYKNGNFYIPKDGSPTTHIVKVPIFRSGVKESIFNEFYCMKLARLVGLEVPEVSILDDGKHPLFIIERYDRIKNKNGTFNRLHQQDFCQAQGVVSEMKYEVKGGPTIKDNYNIVTKNVGIKTRKSATFSFLDWLCFNLLIGNNDSHSKNISLLLFDGKIELAPYYDLLCTEIYPKLTKQFSFQVGGRNDSSRIGKNQLNKLEEELGLKSGTVIERMILMKEKLLENKDILAKELNEKYPRVKIVNRISEFIEKRCKNLCRQGIE